MHTILVPYCGYGFRSRPEADGLYAYPLPTEHPSPATRSGLQPGDRLDAYRLQGGEWNSDFSAFPTGRYGLPVELRVERPSTDETLVLPMTSERVAYLVSLPQFISSDIAGYIIPTPDDCPALSSLPGASPQRNL